MINSLVIKQFFFVLILEMILDLNLNFCHLTFEFLIDKKINKMW